MKIVMQTEAGSRAFRDGTLQKTLMNVADQIKPEAAYFAPENGKRTAYFFFDLQDSSLLPQISEQLFQELNAEVYLTPCMNQEDLQKGLQNAQSSKKNK
ncbi:MAG TPA: hypothetical protein VHO03_20355 [Ignavibacteriales bacterium]|nr:hypothetical protein [Ignavibacteriales bacterium]